MSAVSDRVAEEPVHFTVVETLVLGVDDALEEEIGFLQLVEEEDIVLGESEVAQVIENNQQRPEDFWSVRPLVLTWSEKWVSIMAAFSAFDARTLIPVVLRALRMALSEAVP